MPSKQFKPFEIMVKIKDINSTYRFKISNTKDLLVMSKALFGTEFKVIPRLLETEEAKFLRKFMNLGYLPLTFSRWIFPGDDNIYVYEPEKDRVRPYIINFSAWYAKHYGDKKMDELMAKYEFVRGCC